MVNQKFKYGDSIETAVELLKTIHREKEEERERLGKGKRTKMMHGVEIVTYIPPEIPLELPSDYFSKLDISKLRNTRETWEKDRKKDNAKLQKAIKQGEEISSTVNVEMNIGRFENIQGGINHWSSRLKYIDFLIKELDRAISEFGRSSKIVLVPDTTLSDSVKLIDVPDFPPEYFSGLDLSILRKTRDVWKQELDSKREELRSEKHELERIRKLISSSQKREKLFTQKINRDVLSKEDIKLWEKILTDRQVGLPKFTAKKQISKQEKEEWEKNLPKVLLAEAIAQKNNLERNESYQIKKIEKVEDKLQQMDLLFSMLTRFIDGEFDAKTIKGEIKSLRRKEKRTEVVRDPILEDIKKKMGIPPMQREPLPKIPKKVTVKEKPSTQTMFDAKQIADIARLLKDSKGNQNHEIEASFGVYGESQNFFSGVNSGIYFSNLLDRLNAAVTQSKGAMDVEYSNTRADIRKAKVQPGGQYDKTSNVRRIVDLDTDNVRWEYKDRLHTIDNRIWGVRISKSVESSLASGGKTGKKIPSTLGDLDIDPKDWKPSISRYRKRTTFTEGSTKGFFFGVRIDLTAVRQVDHSRNNPRGFPNFEVEVEKFNDKITAEKFTSIIEQLYKWMFGDYSHSISIRKPLQVTYPNKSQIKWDKQNKVFSDGTFAYMTEKGEIAYGKIVPKHIRALTDKERSGLSEKGKNFKRVKEDRMKLFQETAKKRRSNTTGKGIVWDEKLQIVTDGVYAYIYDKEIKIYAIIVGPEKLSESDKESLKSMNKKFKAYSQTDINKITTKIRKGKEKEKEDVEESVEIYQKKPEMMAQRVFDEEEIIWSPNHIMTLEERRTAIGLHNKLFWYDMKKKRVIIPSVCSKGEVKEKNEDAVRKLRPYQLWSDYWNKPTNIKLKNFLDPRSKWALTLKYDGVRSFLFIHEYGTYMINPPSTLIYMGKGNKDMSGTLLDGEFMSNLDKTVNEYTRITFWAFDILFYRDEDYRSKRLNDRLSALTYTVKSLKENPEEYPYLKMKKYIMTDSPIPKEFGLGKDTDIYEDIKELLQENKNLIKKIDSLLKGIQIPQETAEIILKKAESFKGNVSKDIINDILKSVDFPSEQRRNLVKKVERFLLENKEIVEKTDGLILQPYIWYCNKYTFKWKPPSQLTVDFYLQKMTSKELSDRNIEEDRDCYFTMVGGSIRRDRRVDMSIFNGDYDNPYKGYIEWAPTVNEDSKEPIDGRVVECEWVNFEDDEPDFAPIRIREDRSRPNDYSTAISVWQDIHNPITRDSIEGSNLKIMRKYHNEVKFNLLSNNFRPGSTIIDIGSGRGGDILKWRSLGFKRVYAVDPNSENVNVLLSRLGKDMENKREDDMKKNIPFSYPDVKVLNYGAEKTIEIAKKMSEDKAVLDGIVSFFSLTFFPKSQERYKNLLKTINLIPVGGKFIGIVLSGEKVKTLLDTSNSATIKDYEKGRFMVKGYNSQNPDFDALEGFWDDTINAWTFDNDKKNEIKKYIIEHKIYNCDAFTIEQKGAFNQEDEDEKDGISDNIIGDQIEIDLRGTGDDQSTMVQSQTEWLFNFEYFKKKMKEMQFSLVDSYELNNPVTGPNDKIFSYQNLPKDSQVFSSLNKVFVFKKKGMTKKEIKAVEVLKPLDPEEIDPVKLRLNNVDYDIQRIGIIQSLSSFIHGVLRSQNKKYQGMDISQREKQVSVVREKLAQGLTLDEFQKLHSGTLSAKFKEKVKDGVNQMRIKLGEKTIEEKAMEVFQDTLRDVPGISSGSWMGELEMTEMLSKRYNVNIYVVGVTGIIGETVVVKPSTLFVNDCKSLYGHDKSVVLLRSAGKDYDLLTTNSEFVQQLHKEICG